MQRGWELDAACLEHPEISFVPDAPADVDAARAVCGRCLVVGECLAWALTNHEGGVCGGTTSDERAVLRYLLI